MAGQLLSPWPVAGTASSSAAVDSPSVVVDSPSVVVDSPSVVAYRVSAWVIRTAAVDRPSAVEDSPPTAWACFEAITPLVVSEKQDLPGFSY